ncbi:MarR family winged helix-turn-helix transcriptional regulator [Kitasatospora sp. NPDC057904]|uniref:MarR family winged helix-turn-helix transcriptional regulator n=1 Tax=unclassified Kitasatospora TaxID=2633591 RepID=UPI0036D88C1D
MALTGITTARSGIYLLRALAEAEDASRVTDLAHRLMVKSSHVTRQIDRLQGQRLVARTQDPTDRRARQVELTPEGHAVLDRLKQANITGLADALDGVPDPDVAATVSVLRHLIDRYVQRARATMHTEDGTPALPGQDCRDLRSGRDGQAALLLHRSAAAEGTSRDHAPGYPGSFRITWRSLPH